MKAKNIINIYNDTIHVIYNNQLLEIYAINDCEFDFEHNKCTIYIDDYSRLELDLNKFKLVYYND